MHRLARLLAVRPTEGPRVALLAILLAGVEAARGSGEVATDTLFLSRVGVDALPAVYLILGGVSLVAGVAYLAAIGRFRSPGVPAVILVAAGLVLLVERLLMASGTTAVFGLAWLTVNVINALLLTLVWTVAGSVLDTRQARRLFPLLTGATIVGGFAGTVSAGPIAGLIGAEGLLVVPAALLAGSALVARRIARRFARPARTRPGGTAAPSIIGELRAGSGFVRGSPLLRLIAVAYVLFALLMFSVSFPFLGAVSAASTSEADLATTLGLISAAITAGSFVVAVAAARPIYGRLGIATAALALPLVYLGGFGLWLAAFGLPTAIAVRIAQQVVQRGLTNPAWSAFATTVPAERRAQVLGFLDGVPGQVGTSLSGLLLLAATGWLDRGQLFALGFLAAALCTIVVWRIRRHYGESLLATLRSGLAEQLLAGGPGIDALANDPQVVAVLRTALVDRAASVRGFAVELAGRLARPETIPDLLAATDDDDASIRRTALASLARTAAPGDPTAVAAIERRLADPSDEVRAAAVSALDTLDRQRVVGAAGALAADPAPSVRAGLAVALVRAGQEDRPHAILVELLESAAEADRVAGLDAVATLHGHAPTPAMSGGLRDPSPIVRRAAVRAAAAVDEGLGDPLPALAGALRDDDPGVRHAAALALRDRDGGPAVALEALRSDSDATRSAALDALEGHADTIGEELVDWALARIARAAELRTARRSLLDDPSVGETAEGRFLCSLLAGRQRSAEEQVLGALAVLGMGDASGPLWRGIRDVDPERRAQAIEAIDALGDHRIARSLVTLIEADEGGAVQAAARVLDGLAADRDPWIRALTLRLLRDRHAVALERVVAVARDDPDPLVRMAIARDRPKGDLMPETRDTLDLVERVLFLRGVPIFSGLAPEDLQRIAGAAVERWYPGGTALVREGELGDELVVIVQGTVQVVHETDGTRRRIRDFGPGDHIGEMAVLREMPRAATVIAGDDGVRGLVIAGEGLKAILRERPEAAMAMLASLADRLSAM